MGRLGVGQVGSCRAGASPRAGLRAARLVVALAVLVLAATVPASAEEPLPPLTFSYGCCTRGTVHVLQPDGTLHSVVRASMPVTAGGWSPDGRAYAHVLAGLAGSELQVVEVPSGDTRTALHAPATSLGDVAWSPTGAWIAVVSLTPNAWAWGVPYLGPAMITLVRPDGTGAVPVGPGFSPAWSPDGRQLAFSDLTGGISVVEVHDTGTSSELRTVVSSAREPVWSPQGDRLAYLGPERRDEPPQIRVLDLATGRHWGVQGGAYEAPAWSPNGVELVFVHEGLHAATSDGRSRRTLVDAPIVEGQAAWSPDGRWIAYTTTEWLGWFSRSREWLVHPDGTGARWVSSSQAGAWRSFRPSP